MKKALKISAKFALRMLLVALVLALIILGIYGGSLVAKIAFGYTMDACSELIDTVLGFTLPAKVLGTVILVMTTYIVQVLHQIREDNRGEE